MPEMVGLTLREEAIALASRKLAGQRLKDAKHFVLWSHRQSKDIEQLMKRLAVLPDLAVDPGSRQFTCGIPAAELAQWQAERTAGLTLREIAARHSVSMSTVCRHTVGAES